MKIVTLEDLRNMPDGTVFVEFNDGVLLDDIGILSRRSIESDGRWLYGVEYITPHIDFDTSKVTRKITDKDWIGRELTTYDRIVDDTAYYEYDDDTQFAVFNENEVSNMITVLQDALEKMKTKK